MLQGKVRNSAPFLFACWQGIPKVRCYRFQLKFINQKIIHLLHLFQMKYFEEIF